MKFTFLQKLPPKRWVMIGLLVAVVPLYIAMLAIDLRGGETTILRYTGVWLCFGASLLLAFLCKNVDTILTTVALGFTLLADFFLLVVGDHYEVGVGVFLFVQLLYATRIYLTLQKSPKISLWIRFGVAAVAVILLNYTENLTTLTLLVSLYFPNLVGNAVDAFRLKTRELMFAIGLTLFVLCDICVGLFNFGAVLSANIPQGLYDFANVGMWLFYLPSQVLIALSASFKKINKQENLL